MIETENLNVGHHVVQFNGHDAELAERVTDSLLEALENGAEDAVREKRAYLAYGYQSGAPAAARHFTVGTLRNWGAGDLANDAALVVTELTANAIVHARSGFTLVLSARDDWLRIAVRDGSPRAAPLRPKPLHGLAAVDALASRWGVESLGTAGKTVWVELRR